MITRNSLGFGRRELLGGACLAIGLTYAVLAPATRAVAPRTPTGEIGPLASALRRQPSEPTDETPADDAPTDETPTEESPEEPPTDETPAEETATDDEPAEEPPTDDDPPAEAPPTDDTPPEETPTEDEPTEETPTDDTPSEETPTEDAPPAGEQVLTNSVGMSLMWIEPGEFQMGSPESEEGRLADETLHAVQISRPFYLGQHEVTMGQFKAFIADTNYGTTAEMDKEDSLGYNTSAGTFDLSNYTWRKPGFKQYDDCPVVLVSWSDAQEFCNWLSQKEGVEYRLPTEAEWEYACRAGSAGGWSCGDDPQGLEQLANIADVAFAAKEAKASFAVTWDDRTAFTAPVGERQSNAFGLFDMHGNVWEWCADWHGNYAAEDQIDPVGPAEGEQRVFRGGSYYAGPVDNRCARRACDRPENAVIDVGFRVARNAE